MKKAMKDIVNKNDKELKDLFKERTSKNLNNYERKRTIKNRRTKSRSGRS
jgi:hypothetical protein